MSPASHDRDEKPVPSLRPHLRLPALVMAALLVLLGINVAIGELYPAAAPVIVLIGMVQVGIVVVLAMEIRHQAGIVRLFSALGFMWVAILFTLTMIDYLTR
jgi:cytochrome c oxidase subunit 4